MKTVICLKLLLKIFLIKKLSTIKNSKKSWTKLKAKEFSRVYKFVSRLGISEKFYILLLSTVAMNFTASFDGIANPMPIFEILWSGL